MKKIKSSVHAPDADGLEDDTLQFYFSLIENILYLAIFAANPNNRYAFSIWHFNFDSFFL